MHQSCSVPMSVLPTVETGSMELQVQTGTDVAMSPLNLTKLNLESPKFNSSHFNSLKLIN